jgi:hypothetical protein
MTPLYVMMAALHGLAALGFAEPTLVGYQADPDNLAATAQALGAAFWLALAAAKTHLEG